MNTFRALLLWGLASALSSCTMPYVRLDERKEACHIAVVEKFDHAVFRANSLSGSGGTFAGAGKGMAEGLATGRDAIILAPLGAIIGAGYGTACAAAASRFPNANADFERLLRETDSSSLRRALEARLTSPRPECDAASSTGEPDAVIEIEKVEVAMSCLLGHQEFDVMSEWRTVSTKTAHVLNRSKTGVHYESARGVEDWFAHPAEARSEIELSMAQLGDRMAGQFVGTSAPPSSPGPTQ